jgi:hypothetical protein
MMMQQESRNGRIGGRNENDVSIRLHRIAAPPVGLKRGKYINIEHTAEHYKEILQPGRNIM